MTLIPFLELKSLVMNLLLELLEIQLKENVKLDKVLIIQWFILLVL